MIFHVAARARLLRVDKGLVAFTGGSLEFYTGHNQAHQCHNKYYSHHYRDDLRCGQVDAGSAWWITSVTFLSPVLWNCSISQR